MSNSEAILDSEITKGKTPAEESRQDEDEANSQQSNTKTHQGPAPGIAPTQPNATDLNNAGTTNGNNGFKPFSDYNEGDTIRGMVILDIFFSDENYIIFAEKDSPEGVRYFFTAEKCGEELRKIQAELSKLIAGLAITGEKGKYQYNIASVYAICFNGDPDGAKDLIKVIFEQSNLNDRTRTMGKINYLAYCLGIALVGIVVCICLQYNLNPTYAAALLYTKIAVLGSIGGFISIAIKVSRADMNFDKNTTLQILSAISREFIGIFSALAIYLFIRSNLVIGVLSSANPAVFYAFAILAGFSETFVPDFFNVVEKKTISSQTQQRQSDGK